MKYSVFTVSSTTEYTVEEKVKIPKKYGYDGYLSFEDFSRDNTTEEKLRYSIKYIKELAMKI